MFRSIRLFALPVLFFSLPVHAAFDACLDQFPNRTPPNVSTSAGQVRDLCMDSFAILHSGQSKTAVYVVERLNRVRLAEADEERTDRFYEEARLPSSHRARLADYQGSGRDRGHLASAADMPNPNAMAQSFSLANMVPQAPENNRGIWAKSVEQATRKYAMRAEGDVFVFTGPVFSKPVTTIGSGKVWVPTSLYKLVYDQAQNRAWAFWVDNRDARMSKPISYDELVKRTGIEFLPGIQVSGGIAQSSTPAVALTAVAPSTTVGCGSKRTCKQMVDCAEARHYLNDCGVSSLDGDGDGMPCAKLCR
ncbi:DNA/RNA endonuclease [Thiocystis minor]|uniref:DNA/RNA non-specific endonuclease n=1 Tax=Thiocystis minor TaxID=61597 RepID=UPI0019124F5B|nr:DNA/RNA non-specific endonuclease [Thiocystis minor]MBK5963362.1 DNA/RNA endonuclease [Thiocystis minor]